MDICRTASDMADDKREKLIIDLRDPQDVSRGKVDGAVNVHWEVFDEYKENLPKDRPIYMICYTGRTSDEFAEMLQGEGYEAYSIEDGFKGYLRWKMT